MTISCILLQPDPTRLENFVLSHQSPWVIIDEVQKIPALLDEVHRLIESHKKCFVLTGSSSQKLKQKGVAPCYCFASESSSRGRY